MPILQVPTQVMAPGGGFSDIGVNFVEVTLLEDCAHARQMRALAPALRASCAKRNAARSIDRS